MALNTFLLFNERNFKFNTYFKFITIILSMISDAGRYHERIMASKPLNSMQRQNMYKSCQVKVRKKQGKQKYSSFHSPTRQARNSYLLKVTKQTVINTNYHPKYSQTLQLYPRPALQRENFTRIIGDVRDEDYSVPLSESADHRCKFAHSPSNSPLPLTIKDTHKWRKNLENLDFNKQQSYISQSVQEKEPISTNNSLSQLTFQTLKKTSPSRRLRPLRLSKQLEKIHNFQSYSGHQFLKQLQKPKPQPQYEIINNRKEHIIKRSMNIPHIHTKFDKYLEKIKVRQDREDPQWHTYIQQRHKDINNSKTIDYNLMSDRRSIQEFNKYPIRQNMSKLSNVNKY